MYQMNDDERAARAKQKALHKAIRENYSSGHRYRNLAWAFVRGFKYRRVERTTHVQILEDGSCYEHNRPWAAWIHGLLEEHLPNLTRADVDAWLNDPTGAIPAPAPRPKRPYVAEAPAAE